MYIIYNQCKTKNIKISENSYNTYSEYAFDIKKNLQIIRKTSLKFIKNENYVKKLNNLIIISNPKNQFYLNYSVNNNQYAYSTGMILKTLQLQSRSLRRIKNGINIFFSFFLKKMKNNNNYTIIVNKLNKFNVFRHLLLKLINNKQISIILKIRKNYTKKNYKKISYINKRIRRRYTIE